MKVKNKLWRRKSFALANKPIFIHIPKTGGMTFSKEFKIADLNINNLLHTPARFIKERFPKIYGEEFTFAIIRNPYERFLSACRFNKVEDEDIEELSTMIRNGDVNWCSDFSINHYEHFFTQKHFITDFDNETIIVDYIGRFEDLAKVVEVLKDNNVDITNHFKIKETKSSSWESQLSEKTKENISYIYREDFKLFN